MVKRKRSCSELSATTSCFSSPSRPEAMEIDMSPVSPLIAKSSRYITPSHLPSRTMKRIRDNRPSEEEIHERTLNMLFSAQRSRLSGYPVAGPPSPSPDASHSHLSAAATTSRPTQRSLHSFWHIKSHPKPSASSMPPPVDLGSLSPANCESCDVDLTATMDVDGYGLEADYMCDDCLVEYMMQLPRSRSPELSPFGGLQGRVVKDVVAMIWAFGHMTLLSIRTR